MTKNQKENYQFKEKVNEKFGHIDDTMKNLEMMIGQIASIAQTRTQGSIPSTTVTNPNVNDQCKAVTLRSGKNFDSMPIMDGQGSSGISHAWADEVLVLHSSNVRAGEVCKGSPELLQKAQHGQDNWYGI